MNGKEQAGFSSEADQVRWSGGEILVVVLMGGLWAYLSYEILRASGFYRWYYGPELLKAAQGNEPATRSLANARLNLWAGCFGFPLYMVSALGLLYGLAGVRPQDLGLTFRQFGRNVLLGVAGALLLTPLVLGFNGMVLAILRFLGVSDSQDHQFTLLIANGLSPFEWIMLTLGAVVVAPVSEEFLFRGLLQPWFGSRRWGGHLAMAAAFLWSILMRQAQIQEASAQGISALAREMVPSLAVFALLPVFLLVFRFAKSPFAPAWFGTAVLFAWVHASVWPSPIPLFVLALGLGYLAYRTRSLVAPITVHALFNGAAVVIGALKLE
jgi:membrane protease YdiL (CAAX protease family)